VSRARGPLRCPSAAVGHASCRRKNNRSSTKTLTGRKIEVEVWYRLLPQEWNGGIVSGFSADGMTRKREVPDYPEEKRSFPGNFQ
jgi:hypothetical protein